MTDHRFFSRPCIHDPWEKLDESLKKAKGFAERMGCRWTDNLHRDLAYDFEIFKPTTARLVKVRQTANL